MFTFENIPYGNWIICELKPADGYLENTEIYHVQINSNEQIIEINVVNDRIPEIKTQASVDGKKEVTAGGKVTIDDVVEYKHLIPGKEYVIKGILMDKSTGKPLKINGKEITSEVKFIPEKSNETVTVTFTFDSSEIKKETDIVVFESLFCDGVEIATHADIKDEGQTVTVKIPAPKTPKTGDERNYGVWIGLGAIALGGVFSALILKIKSRKDDDE